MNPLGFTYYTCIMDDSDSEIGELFMKRIKDVEAQRITHEKSKEIWETLKRITKYSLVDSIEMINKHLPSLYELKYFHALNSDSVASNQTFVNVIFKYCRSCMYWICEHPDEQSTPMAREVAYVGMTLLVECGDRVNGVDRQIHILLSVAEASLLRDSKESTSNLIQSRSHISQAFHMIDSTTDEEITERLNKAGKILLDKLLKKVLFKNIQDLSQQEFEKCINTQAPTIDIIRKKCQESDVATAIHLINERLEHTFIL